MRIGRVAAAALASCFMGWTGAQAQSIQLDGPYVRIEGGWNHLSDLSFTGSHGLAGSETNAEGFLIGGAFGYKMGPWHFEINTDYRNNGVDGLSLTNPGILPLHTGSLSGFNGSVTALTDMINATYDLPWSPMPRLTPYIGVGVGAAIVRLNSVSVNNVPISAPNTNDAVPAIQPILGLRYDFDPVRSISLEYRFVNGFSPSFKDSANGTLNTSDYQSHSIILALTWSLGAVAAPPPPPPAPAAAEAPPPPPPPPAGARNEFIVYFDFDKSSLTAAARQILDEAASAYMQNKTVKIQVTGYTDTVGTVAYNLALSVRRADSVRNYLRGKGVPVNAMDVQGKGKTDLRVPTPDGVREPQNRRVEIVMP